MPDDLQQELAHIKDALAQLGARACVHCGRFYLTASPANLFNSGTERVCYPCISAWWRARCPTLTIPERQAIEPKLMRWLIEHHEAKVFRELDDLPPPTPRTSTSRSAVLNAPVPASWPATAAATASATAMSGSSPSKSPPPTSCPLLHPAPFTGNPNKPSRIS